MTGTAAQTAMLANRIAAAAEQTMRWADWKVDDMVFLLGIGLTISADANCIADGVPVS